MSESELLSVNLVEQSTIDNQCEVLTTNKIIEIKDANNCQSFIERIRTSILQDSSLKEVFEALKSKNAPKVRNFSLVECEWMDNILYYRGLVVVPQCELDEVKIESQILALNQLLPP